MDLTQAILIAALGGLIPSILWLMFWLREDGVNPEPRRLIIEVFIAGIICTLVALPLEFGIAKLAGSSSPTFPLFIIWAAIEETLKFAACYYVVLRTKDDDEPIDAVIYMIIVALGFAALENSLFIFNPLFSHNNLGAFVTGNLRFIGASLLHVLSSSIVGIFIAFSFYKPKIHMKINVIIGLFFAVIVHTLFNTMVIDKMDGGLVLIAFSLVWWGIIALIVMFEKVKILKPSSKISNIETFPISSDNHLI